VFMFLFLVALQGACMALLSRRLFQRISVIVQSLLLVLVLSSLFVMSDLIVAVRNTQVRLYQLLFLPAWFTALYDRLLGIKPLHASSLTWHFSVIALVVALLLATVFYALAYRRHLGFFSQPSESRDGGPGIAAALLGTVRRAFTREPESAAAFDFVTATLARSPRHRLVLGSCLGVALAFCLSALFIMITRGGEASLHRLSVTLLGIPAMLSLFLLGGVRFAFTLPSELGANWVFRMPAFRQEVFWRGTRGAIWTVILGPVFLVTLVFFTFCWGWRTGLQFTVLQALCALVLAEWLFLSFPKIPFTCSYLPGKADLKCRWPVYVVLFAGYVLITGHFCLALSRRSPGAYLLILGLGGLLLVGLFRRRKSFLLHSRPVFEEQSGLEFLKLGLANYEGPAGVTPRAESELLPRLT